jgi:hypothetical protein
VLAARRYADGRGDNTVLGPDLGWRIDDSLAAARPVAALEHHRADDGQGLLATRRGRDGDRLYLRLNRNTDDAKAELKLDESSAGFPPRQRFRQPGRGAQLSRFQSVGWRRWARSTSSG